MDGIWRLGQLRRSGNRGGGSLRQLVEVGDRGCCRSARSGVAAAGAGGRRSTRRSMSSRDLFILIPSTHPPPTPTPPSATSRFLAAPPPGSTGWPSARPPHQRSAMAQPSVFVCTTSPFSPIQPANHGAGDSPHQPRGSREAPLAAGRPPARCCCPHFRTVSPAGSPD